MAGPIYVIGTAANGYNTAWYMDGATAWAGFTCLSDIISVIPGAYTGAYNYDTNVRTVLPNGTYYLMYYPLTDSTLNYDPWMGVVVTDGTGDFAVDFDITAETLVHNNATTASVEGYVYSPALAAADAAGFMWAELWDIISYGYVWYIDQSFNQLAYGTTTLGEYQHYWPDEDPYPIGIWPDPSDPYDIWWWLCDPVDGSFVFNVTGNSSRWNDGYVFPINGGGGSIHYVHGVEGVYDNDDYYFEGLVGGNKSATNITPKFATAWNITATVVAGDGTITEPGTIMKKAGNPVSYAYTMTPATDCRIQKIEVNDVEVPVIVADGAAQTYTFTTHTQDQTIKVWFEEIPPPSTEVDYFYFINAGVQSVQISKKLDLQAGLIAMPGNIPWDELVGYSAVWSCNNTTLATVSQQGVVTGKKAGMCVITATITGPNDFLQVVNFSLKVY